MAVRKKKNNCDQGNNHKEEIKSKKESLIKKIKEKLDADLIDRKFLEHVQTEYSRLKKEERYVFLNKLQETVEIDPDHIAPLISAVEDSTEDPCALRQALVDLRSGIESPRFRFFREFVGLPGGLKFLLDLRLDILNAQRHGGLDLGPLDHDLVWLFESWFHDGFLFLEEITLDSPYRQIELIKNGDMVHPMTNLEEMGRRLGKDRRCFALYHHAMPEEPVVFIEVALTDGIVRSIHDIIHDAVEEEDASKKDTAVFYSINNTQNGLAGLGLGKVLIFQVVDFLKREAPQIKNFCTLSPMPGFWRRYLKPLLEGRGDMFKTGVDDVEKLFDKRLRTLLKQQYVEQGGQPDAPLKDMILKVFSHTAWAKNKPLVQAIDKPLTRLGYIYLAEEKRNERPLDPVANFHLGNGATLSPKNVNFGANWSTMGLERSLSLMVNYVYSIGWGRQISDSITRLGGLIPGASRRWNGSRYQYSGFEE